MRSRLDGSITIDDLLTMYADLADGSKVLARVPCRWDILVCFNSVWSLSIWQQAKLMTSCWRVESTALVVRVGRHDWHSPSLAAIEAPPLANA